MEALKDYSDEEKDSNSDGEVFRSSQSKTRKSPSSKDQAPKIHHNEEEKSHSPSHHTKNHKRDCYAHRSPIHRHRSPAHHRSSPTHHHRSPAHRHRSPAHRHRSPAHRHRSPAHRHRSLAHRHRSRSPVQKHSNSEKQQKSKKEYSKTVVSAPDSNNANTTSMKSVSEVNVTQSLPIGNKVQQPVANKKKLLWSSKPQVAKSWNNWESASFEGDEAAQSKFRRLMGIKGSSLDEKAPNKGVAATSNVLKNLESQYETSRFMTHLAKGAGLGFGVVAQITPTTFDPNDTDKL